MISLQNLSREDLKLLFDGFTTEFLQKPLRKPSKSLNRYIPNGFRPDKMPRHMLIKMYCDAVSGQEHSLSKFVTAEIERHFERVGLDEYIKNIQAEDMGCINLAISEISISIWDGGLAIPAHLVLHLYGIICSEKQVAASDLLYRTHFDSLEESKRSGKEEGLAEAAAELQAESKRYAKLQKKTEALEEQSQEQSKSLANLESINIALEEQLSEYQELAIRLQETIEIMSKQIALLKNDLVSQQIASAEKDKQLIEITERSNRIPELEAIISELRIALDSAKAMAFTDDVIKRLSMDVLDELRASSLGATEILELAKRRFSEAVSIDEAWQNISNYSDCRITGIISILCSEQYSHKLLDELEEIEDGILIKYAVIKSLKSVLYYGLEELAMRKTISDEFTVKEGITDE